MSRFKFNVTSDFIVNSLCAITIGTGVVEYGVNVFFNKSYVQRFKEAKKDGNPVELSKTIRKRFDDVVNDLKYTNFQKAFVTPFVAKDLNTENVGCLNTRTGCYIGIPSFYDLETVDDTSVMNNEHMQLLNDNSEYGKKIIESLNFSESAKKYSIARELCLTDNSRIFIKSLSFPTILMPMYAFGNTIITSLPANPFRVRALAFFLLCNLGLFVWVLVRSAIENFYQFDADKKVCNISEEYIRGGIEYYEKLMQRNLALRNIIPGGDELYSDQGDDLGFFTVVQELPLSQRKNYLEHRLNNCTNEINKT